jgi:exportin-2 (importin alpha re-exporter)
MHVQVVALTSVAQNPLNASFNHYLFESIAALIKSAVKANPTSASSFETLLFPVLQKVPCRFNDQSVIVVFSLFLETLTSERNRYWWTM